MQLLPMASSPDGLISAQYAVITKTPGWEQGGGVSEWGPSSLQLAQMTCSAMRKPVQPFGAHRYSIV